MNWRVLRPSARLLVILALITTASSMATAQQGVTTTGGVAKSAGPTFPGSAIPDPRIPDSVLPTIPSRERTTATRDTVIDPGLAPGDPEIAQKGDENANQ